MNTRRLVPLALALGTVIGSAAPALARRVEYINGRRVVILEPGDPGYWESRRESQYRNRYYDSRTGQYYDYSTDRSYRFNRRNDPDGRKQQLADRAEEVARKAETRYQRGNLSRDHLDRTLVKLDRIWNDLDRDDRMSADRFRANMDHLERAEQTLNDWTEADRNRNLDERRWRR